MVCVAGTQLYGALMQQALVVPNLLHPEVPVGGEDCARLVRLRGGGCSAPLTVHSLLMHVHSFCEVFPGVWCTLCVAFHLKKPHS